MGGTILVAPLASEVQQAGNLARIAHVGRMMRPGQPAHSHSIIAVLGESPVIGKTDGIVAYESAHLDGVESEKIVRSSHSCQAVPDTILEVRRILLEHVANR